MDPSLFLKRESLSKIPLILFPYPEPPTEVKILKLARPVEEHGGTRARPEDQVFSRM